MKRADLEKRAQRDKFGSGKHGFQSGNPAAGLLPTIPGAEWFNHIQEEICNVIEAAGGTINPGQYNQLKAAIEKIVEEKSGGRGLPVGAIVAFPRAISSPEGYLKCDGSTFNQATYPDLYAALSNSNRLPDLLRSDVGMTAYFPVDDIPAGWLMYDDIADRVNQSDYPELYRKLVAQYGSISAVPKAEDRFLRGASGGLTVGTVQADEIKKHVHKHMSSDVTGADRISKRSKYFEDNDGITEQDGMFTANTDSAVDDNGWVTPKADSPFATGGAETRPKALVMVLCIKAKNSLDDVVFWIKAYGKVTNAGLLDASTLAAGLQDKADKSELREKADKSELREKANKSHTHPAADITDFKEAVGRSIERRNSGGFDIIKFPDGTLIETGTVRIENHNNATNTRTLTWPLAFVAAPVVSATVSGADGNVRDVWVTIDSRQSTLGALRYWLHETLYNTPDVTVHFIGVGRWK